jgi:hypothetical protein
VTARLSASGRLRASNPLRASWYPPRAVGKHRLTTSFMPGPNASLASAKRFPLEQRPYQTKHDGGEEDRESRERCRIPRKCAEGRLGHSESPREERDCGRDHLPHRPRVVTRRHGLCGSDELGGVHNPNRERRRCEKTPEGNPFAGGDRDPNRTGRGRRRS